MKYYKNDETTTIIDRIYVIRLKLVAGYLRGNVYYSRISSCIGIDMLDFEPEMLLTEEFVSNCEFRLIDTGDGEATHFTANLHLTNELQRGVSDKLSELCRYITGIEIFYYEDIMKEEQREKGYMKNLLGKVVKKDYLYWGNKVGRTSKQNEVIEYRRMHPKATQADCRRELQISAGTINKHWRKFKEEQE